MDECFLRAGHAEAHLVWGENVALTNTVFRGGFHLDFSMAQHNLTPSIRDIGCKFCTVNFDHVKTRLLQTSLSLLHSHSFQYITSLSGSPHYRLPHLALLLGIHRRSQGTVEVSRKVLIVWQGPQNSVPPWRMCSSLNLRSSMFCSRVVEYLHI